MTATMALSWAFVLYQIVFIAPCFNQAAEVNHNNVNLTFMLITSFGQFGFNSSGGLPAAEMALEDINNNPDVLPGYNLVYDSIRDSQVRELPSIIMCHFRC